MIRHLLCAAATALCLVPAHAAVKTYDWSFTGGFLEYGYPKEATLQGSFTVNDLDANGAFDKSELVSLEYAGRDFVSCSSCTLYSFAWTPGQAPAFYINSSFSDGYSYLRQTLHTGESYSFFYNYGEGEPYYGGGDWTPAVTWSVTAVPEPQTWLMLGAGVFAIGAAARRRKAV
ncbi:PEP-CTERM sorting domain-containing protein [Massilia aquatica]|uniref:PEP-CTERM sorting domain-containing protein n=1 Tax=Massilia aquatica TaxID=2609000 RepID=A0ABX0M2M0_9BURK|nr:PEP-CTERM sorting domain-containing protein [Massilia aquatica]NHZ40853.1 PEP-CTERM sorting domain-containing protein [Massilia aquatica]